MDAGTTSRSSPLGAVAAPRLAWLGERLGLAGWLLPAYLAMFSISAYPLAHNLITSFYGEAVIGQAAPFVGLKNYQTIVTAPAFSGAVGRTLVWTVGVVGLAFLVGLGLALLLNQPFAGVRLARVLFLIPWATPSIASAIIWRFLYNTDFGVINVGLRGAGLEVLALGWMTDPKVALFAAMLAHIWRTYGFYMIMLLGALQAVPRDLIEAAMIDGAGAWRRLLAVTLPQIQPVIVMVILLELIWVTNNFDTIFVLTGGGPLRSSETLPLFVYQTAFQSTRFAEAAAGSVLLFLIALGLIVLYLMVLRRTRGREEAL